MAALRAKKQCDQLLVGGRKRQRRQFFARHPSHLLSELRRRAPERLARKEMQFHAAIRIVVPRRENLSADARLDVQFFSQLEQETRVERFARIALAARKFPEPFE